MAPRESAVIPTFVSDDLLLYCAPFSLLYADPVSWPFPTTSEIVNFGDWIGRISGSSEIVHWHFSGDSETFLDPRTSIARPERLLLSRSFALLPRFVFPKGIEEGAKKFPEFTTPPKPGLFFCRMASPFHFFLAF